MATDAFLFWNPRFFFTLTNELKFSNPPFHLLTLKIVQLCLGICSIYLQETVCCWRFIMSEVHVGLRTLEVIIDWLEHQCSVTEDFQLNSYLEWLTVKPKQKNWFCLWNLIKVKHLEPKSTSSCSLVIPTYWPEFWKKNVFIALSYLLKLYKITKIWNTENQKNITVRYWFCCSTSAVSLWKELVIFIF